MKWKRKPPKKVFNFETAYKRFKCLHVLFATISVALVNTKEDVLWIWNKICAGRWSRSKTSFLCTAHASLHFFEQRKPSLSGRASQFLEFRLNDIICFNKHLISIFINRAMQQCFGNGIFNCLFKTCAGSNEIIGGSFIGLKVERSIAFNLKKQISNLSLINELTNYARNDRTLIKNNVNIKCHQQCSGIATNRW